MKPDKILENLTKEPGLTIPLKANLNNFLWTTRTQLFGKSNMNLGELASWCLEHYEVPENPDEGFVVDYNIFFPDDEPNDRRGDFEIDPKTKKPDVFRFFVTSKRLLKYAANAQVLLHTDGTYSLIWQGFPVIILGTSDCDRTFHPLGISVCSKEAHFDYKFVFNSLIFGRERINEEPLGPLALMADAAGAITNGFLESSLIHLIRAMCWFHCKNAVDKKLNAISDKIIRAEIISEICILQLCQTPTIFEAGVKLFILKWANIENLEVRVFIAYLKKEWIDQNSNFGLWKITLKKQIQ